MTIRVLIVDDHAVMAEGLRSLIEAQDDLTVVDCVGNGREALQRAQAIKPDVVVMDIAMPELNGIDATQLIQERADGTQVIILTMHANPEYVFRALRAGARGYVLKKNAATEVLAAIRAAHTGHRFLSREVSDYVIDDYLQGGTGNPLEVISSRERQVLQLLAEGKSTINIAESLSLSPKTIETYRGRIMQKLGLSDIPSLVKFAIQHGLTTID